MGMRSGGRGDGVTTVFDVLREDARVLRNAERDGTSIAPGYAGLLACRIEDVLEQWARLEARAAAEGCGASLDASGVAG